MAAYHAEASADEVREETDGSVCCLMLFGRKSVIVRAVSHFSSLRLSERFWGAPPAISSVK